MNKKWIGIGLCAVVLVGLIFMTAKKADEKKSVATPEPVASPLPKATNELSKNVATAEVHSLQTKTPATVLSTNTQAIVSAEWSPDVAEQLESLKATYRPGGLPARIRIQDQIGKLWMEEPPTSEQLLGLINDADAPEEYRVYFAKVLRNQIKCRAFDESELSFAIAGMQDIIGSDTDSALFRSELAMLLTTVDQSDKTIQTVLPLLDSSDDETATRAIAALCNTTSPLAIESLYEFVQEYAELLRTKPTALGAALAPLSTVHDYDIVPVIQGVVSTTDNFDLMHISLQCLMRVPSSQATLKAITTAYESSAKIPEQTAYVQYLCKTALEQHSTFLQENKSTLDQSLIEKIQGIGSK